MPIKFVDLLQESWNFIRNRPNFALFAVVTLVTLQFVAMLFAPSEEMITPQQMDMAAVMSVLLFTIVISIISLLVNVLIILNIKSINNGNYHHFFQNIAPALKAFLPALFLTFVMALPLSLGFVVGVRMPVLGLPLILLGFFLFVKLSLSLYVYLLEEPQKSLGETLKFTMRLSRGKMLPLVMFCVISYLIPGILSRWVAALGQSLIGSVIVLLFSAFISVFVAVFGFRFYQAYRRLPAAG